MFIISIVSSSGQMTWNRWSPFSIAPSFFVWYGKILFIYIMGKAQAQRPSQRPSHSPKAFFSYKMTPKQHFFFLSFAKSSNAVLHVSTYPSQATTQTAPKTTSHSLPPNATRKPHHSSCPHPRHQRLLHPCQGQEMVRHRLLPQDR